ncbi:hypothetical protein M3Y95_01147500 [Aphelenchoides besseyi]|nr:hypothetical protein M3Y95_01147500 [Aphelenchoides besseyi]
MNTLPRNAQSSARGGASNSVRGRRLPESSANGAQNNGSRASSSLVDAAGDRFAHLYYNDDTVDERRVEDAIMIYRQHQIPHSTNSSTVRVKLFEAADYYGLENLEILVVKSMTNNFSINTVLCYLELAFKYENKLQTFKQNVLEYAVKNMREIVELSGWKKFYEKHHTIVHALLTFGR